MAILYDWTFETTLGAVREYLPGSVNPLENIDESTIRGNLAACLNRYGFHMYI